MLPSNKNNSKLVINLNITRDITKIIPMEKNMIIVGLIEIYLEMKNDKSTYKNNAIDIPTARFKKSVSDSINPFLIPKTPMIRNIIKKRMSIIIFKKVIL